MVAPLTPVFNTAPWNCPSDPNKKRNITVIICVDFSGFKIKHKVIFFTIFNTKKSLKMLVGGFHKRFKALGNLTNKKIHLLLYLKPLSILWNYYVFLSVQVSVLAIFLYTLTHWNNYFNEPVHRVKHIHTDGCFQAWIYYDFLFTADQNTAIEKKLKTFL